MASTLLTKITETKNLNQRKEEYGTAKTVTVKSQMKSEERNKNRSTKTYGELLKELKGTGKLWEDPDFRADSSSIGAGLSSKMTLVWKRPKEIAKSPKLFVDGISRFDVKQGKLGDCWLLAVIATLSLYDPLFDNVVPSDQDYDENYIGAFRFRFWRFGTWREVIVDDRIPTTQGQLVFMRSSDKDEFWSALLEKAYAKLSGSYEAMTGGSQLEAMEDFTGGLCETIKLNEKDVQDELFEIMVDFILQSSLMGCAIESKQKEDVQTNGLLKGHAYSITGLERVKLNSGESVELVRVRNPWGNEVEWKGPWCDNAAEWNTVVEEDKTRVLSHSKFQNDGEFWMSFNDFVANFTKLEVCHLGPESLDETIVDKKRWEMSWQEGSWTKNVNAGGCKSFFDSFVMNPQIRMEITDADDDADDNKGTVIIGLMQKDMRSRNLPFYHIGYTIYEIKDPNCGILKKATLKFAKAVATSVYSNKREVCEKHKLPRGYYVIIPTTKDPNQEADYMIRIFTRKPNHSSELDEENNKISVPLPLDVTDDGSQIEQFEKEMEELFNKVAGSNEVINASQVKTIVNNVIGKDMEPPVEFDFEVCRSMIALFDDNCTGKMELSEFIDLLKSLRTWKGVFKEFDEDNSGTFNAFEFRNALNNCGFSVSNATFKVLVNRYSQLEEGVICFVDFILAVIRLTNAFDCVNYQQRDDQQRLVILPEEFVQGLLYM